MSTPLHTQYSGTNDQVSSELTLKHWNATAMGAPPYLHLTYQITSTPMLPKSEMGSVVEMITHLDVETALGQMKYGSWVGL